jgi:23S rRNA-/tRNA-specific pseudouridylate synthase
MYPPREAERDLVVLGERDGIVAVHKPAEASSVADHHGTSGSLAAALVRHFGPVARSFEPSSRLDVGVSGVVLYATQPASRAWLARARAEGLYRRHYVAIALRAPVPDRGTWSWPIGRARDPRLRAVFGKDPKPAETQYALVAVSPADAAMLAVEPQTGRTHQIRVHASHASAPLWGDVAYGGPSRIVSPSGAVSAVRRVALHAAWVKVPTRPGGRPWCVQAPIGADLEEIWAALGGQPSAWKKAALEW